MPRELVHPKVMVKLGELGCFGPKRPTGDRRVQTSLGFPYQTYHSRTPDVSKTGRKGVVIPKFLWRVEAAVALSSARMKSTLGFG